MQATQTELEKIQEFLEIVSKTDFSPYSIYWVKYLQAQQPAGDLIQILNEEYDEQVSIYDFEEFVQWYVKELVKEAYDKGQDNLRKAVKELLGLNV